MDLRQYNHGLPLQLTNKDYADTDPVKDRFFLTTEELAIRWRKSPRTIENHRGKSGNVPYYKVNGSVLYDLNDVIEFELKGFFKAHG